MKCIFEELQNSFQYFVSVSFPTLPKSFKWCFIVYSCDFRPRFFSLMKCLKIFNILSLLTNCHHLSIVGIPPLFLHVCKKLKLTCLCGANWGIMSKLLWNINGAFILFDPWILCFYILAWIVSIDNNQ